MNQSSLGFVGGSIDRAAQWRTDETWLAERLSDGRSLAVPFAGERPLIDVSNGRMRIAYRRLAQIAPDQDADPVLLGLNGSGGAVFAVQAGDDARIGTSDPEKLIDLRSLATQGLLAPADLGLLAQARTLLHWHATHRFCARCGRGTDIRDGGYRRVCAACGASHFPRTDPVAIMVVTSSDGLLLGRSAHFPPGLYSALAGFIEPGETIEEGARREVFEEAGIRVGRVIYHSSQPWPFPASLMIGVIGEALSGEIVIDPAEVEDVRWFAGNEVLAMLEDRHPQGLKTPLPMAIAHHLIRAALGG